MTSVTQSIPTPAYDEEIMSHTYSSNRVHVIFSTKAREEWLSAEIRGQLWPYMAGIAHHHGFEALKIGGWIDHAHALLLVPPTIAIAKAVQMLKGSSSHWLKGTGKAGTNFAWQEGYAAFSVSASQTQEVINYIANQASHHAKRNFEQEFLAFLNKNGVNYDPRFVMG